MNCPACQHASIMTGHNKCYQCLLIDIQKNLTQQLLKINKESEERIQQQLELITQEYNNFNQTIKQINEETDKKIRKLQQSSSNHSTKTNEKNKIETSVNLRPHRRAASVQSQRRIRFSHGKTIRLNSPTDEFYCEECRQLINFDDNIIAFNCQKYLHRSCFAKYLSQKNNYCYCGEPLFTK